MSLLEIVAVDRAEKAERLWGWSIDRPVPGAREEAGALIVAGWVLGRDSPAVAVELVHEGEVFRRLPVSLPRMDVAAAYPEVPDVLSSGFVGRVSLLGTAELRLVLQAVLQDQSRVPLAVVRARRYEGFSEDRMIVFAELGDQWGRLGNQLFQMAATIALAVDHGDRFGFPRWRYENRFNLQGCFYDDIDRYWSVAYDEPTAAYSRIPYASGLNLRGYFQSEHYFAHQASMIRNLFRTRWDKIDACFIHVRRGDYLLEPEFYSVLTMEYFERAMHIFLYDRYIVFSDDLAWCKTRFLGPQFEFSEDRDNVEDLQLMACCKAGIISNSTFSWWGAWLGGHDNVIAPAQWIGPDAGTWDPRDVIPSRWITLDAPALTSPEEVERERARKAEYRR